MLGLNVNSGPLFSSRIFLGLASVTLLFVFNNYYLIID